MKPAPIPLETVLSDLEALPDAPFFSLVALIGNSDLPTLIKLASTNKRLQTKIYRSKECRHLWKVIDFSKIGSDRTERLDTYVKHRYGVLKNISEIRPHLILRERLTDASLEALLRRTDAVNTTEELILIGCKQVTGSGLGPLTGSKVLRALDLRFSREKYGTVVITSPDIETTHSVVKSLPPFARRTQSQGGLIMLTGLFNFALNVGQRESRIRLQFSERLADDIQQNMTPCGHCHRAMSKQIIPTGKEGNFNANTCGLCKVYQNSKEKWANWIEEEFYPIPPGHHTVKGFAELAVRMVCYECRKMSCHQNGCPVTQRCDNCLDQRCTKCAKMSPCKFCARLYCSTDCSEIDQCDGCGVESVCGACVAEGDNDDTDIWTCEGCYKVKSCDNCNKVGECYSCKKNFCTDCGMGECSKCGREICEEHLRSCDSCGILTCNGCQSQCFTCDLDFCNRCMSQGVCDKCRGDQQTVSKKRKSG